MNRYLLYAVIWSALVLGAVADLAVHYPRLPEKVATHFNESGRPDGWSTPGVMSGHGRAGSGSCPRSFWERSPR